MICVTERRRSKRRISERDNEEDIESVEKGQGVVLDIGEWNSGTVIFSNNLR